MEHDETAERFPTAEELAELLGELETAGTR